MKKKPEHRTDTAAAVPEGTRGMGRPGPVDGKALREFDTGFVTTNEDLQKPTGLALIAAMQASPHRDIDIEPSRAPMPVRQVSALR